MKQLYLRMQEALEYLDSPTKVSALVKRNSAVNAIEARIAALEVSNRLADSSYEESAQHARENIGRRYRGRLISSGVFATVCAAILPFSQKLSENALFSPLLSVFWVRFLLAAVFALSGLGFVLMRIEDLRLKQKVSVLLSEDGIAWTVCECINKYNDEPDCTITQRKMMDKVCKCGTKWHQSKAVRLLWEELGTKVPRDLAEKIAKLQISRLVKRGVIRCEGIRGIEPLYVIDISLAKEIIEDHGAILFEHELS